MTLYGWDGDQIAWEGDAETTTHYVFEPGSFVPLLQAKTRQRIPLIPTPDWSERDYDIDADPLWTYSPEPQAFEQLYYYHTDHLGTPQELLDAEGNLAWSADYKAWGEARAAISEAAKRAGISNPLRFQGQYFDHETGLHYNRHRYYDPSVGRFISKDPIGLHGGLNIFAYAPNPTEWVDPWGLTGVYIFRTTNQNGYVGKGPRRRYMSSTRQRTRDDGSHANQGHLSNPCDKYDAAIDKGIHVDLKGKAPNGVSDDHYAEMVEYKAMETLARTPGSNLLNQQQSAGKNRYANQSPQVQQQVDQEAQAIINAYNAKPNGGGRR
ncbi:RHS repeat-associated core domain-containing protein [Chitinilyticum litopenaei]|uniref:RHS repeat-associated core domain-containing protein n=1 Tax=Chitinilyticum litopenaei TaxID=1121276 RepID=UPI00041CBFA0|nr:RHS repeat-associated core domain-containing protein [Chitinilyticum litopenaei]